ncbi:DUF4440 domain-containing protein [Roseimicrobium sp. ORNL1]|nr:DUF4440 domain-containing protein [Roseimicrobium sp. ORNL1]
MAVALLALVLIPSCGADTPKHPDDTNIRAFLDRYFSTWSAQDMEGYGACFDSQARILFVDKDGSVMTQGLTDFLHGQKLGHQQSSVPMVEKPLTKEIMGDGRVVQAKVTWLLTKGSSETRGTDYFTLKREGQGWKIVALVFNND